MNLRPEDRTGIRPGTPVARLNTGIYRTFARVCHHLPNFRGKIRSAEMLYRALGLESHHIFQESSIGSPTDYKALLDFHSRHERWAFLMNDYEPETAKFLLNCFDGQGCFLDIGANIGLIALPFSKLAAARDGSSPKVICIEPVSANAERLTTNIALNHLQDSVSVIAKAVGDLEKTVEIQVEGNLKDGEGSGTANILAENSTHPCERIEIELTTIDRLVETGKIPSSCSLIKIDVDGYDLKVLQGSTELLKRGRPIIFGEFMEHCLNWHGQSHSDVIRFISTFEYTVFSRICGSFQFLPIEDNKVNQDLLLVPQEKVQNIGWCLKGRQRDA